MKPTVGDLQKKQDRRFIDRRIILHVDMDAFFASIEQKANPRLRGRPVAVIGQKKRTIILTSSYEARRYGVKTGMRPFEAKRLCPEIILIEADQAKYIDASSRIFRILQDFTPLVEVYSVDEMFLDLSGTSPHQEGHDFFQFQCAQEIALSIKKRIYKEIGITCSIGIAQNKLIAKLASDQSKPDGLTIISPEGVCDYLEDLPVGELCGIGDKTERALRALDIKTCGNLARAEVGLLRHRFGILGEILHEMGCGLDPRPVVPLGEEQDEKSIGHNMTLREDVDSMDEIRKFLLELSEKVGRRLRRARFSAQRITLNIRYSDFSSFSVQRSLPRAIRCSEDIFTQVCRILNTLRLTRSVRLLGVSVSHLDKSDGQLCFWNKEKYQLQEACDRINDLYGEFSVYPAFLLRRSIYPGAITPSWRPEGTRRVEFKAGHARSY